MRAIGEKSTLSTQLMPKSKMKPSSSRKNKNVSLSPDLKYKEPQIGTEAMKHRPLVIGFGPAGMFSALLLAQMGYRPIVLERGQKLKNV